MWSSGYKEASQVGLMEMEENIFMKQLKIIMIMKIWERREWIKNEALLWKHLVSTRHEMKAVQVMVICEEWLHRAQNVIVKATGNGETGIWGGVDRESHQREHQDYPFW